MARAAAAAAASSGVVAAIFGVECLIDLKVVCRNEEHLSCFELVCAEGRHVIGDDEVAEVAVALCRCLPRTEGSDEAEFFWLLGLSVMCLVSV